MADSETTKEALSPAFTLEEADLIIENLASAPLGQHMSIPLGEMLMKKIMASEVYTNNGLVNVRENFTGYINGFHTFVARGSGDYKATYPKFLQKLRVILIRIERDCKACHY